MQLKRTNLNDKITDTIDDFNDNWANIEDSLGLKADKQQEEWITPTLLNGWSAPTKIGYYKDNFGVVRIRGRITGGTGYAFILPIGYRPSIPVQFPVVANGVVGYFMVENSGGLIRMGGSNTNVNLDSISFKAEG